MESLRQTQRTEHSSKTKKRITMDFGVVLIIANSLLAAFIYLVLSWLWQD